MKRLFYVIFSLFLLFPLSVQAQTVVPDPQYVVINFSDSFHFLNWSAPGAEWQAKIKPEAIARLRRIESLLTVGTESRKLAWSTLMEYMNYPTDTPSDSSPYIVRMKRMMELAEEVDLPIFIPLNGVQWWDEMPELWNWWDKDGNQTPGCTNDNYSSCPFKKLQDPSYRKRFIAGYDPDNKWNVDWSDWITPEKFAIRNWGSGDIFVAPSPNLANEHNNVKSFRSAQKERYEALLKVIHTQVDVWSKERKEYLFAGLSIGTEITLNGALIPGDSNFKPYGYRAIQDMFCPNNNPTCGENASWTYNEITQKREAVIHDYIQDFAYSAFIDGFPKQRVYTHVWSEAEPGELRYMNAIGASVSYFSRPGLSIYGKALDPLAFSVLSQTLADNGYPAWAAPEFAPLNRDDGSWKTALVNTLDTSQAPARLIDIYNETDVLSTPAIPELKNILTETPSGPTCQTGESTLLTPNRVTNPKILSWKRGVNTKESIIIWKRNTIPDTARKTETEYDVTNKTRFIPPAQLENGYYYWAVKDIGCDGKKYSISTPRIFYVEQPLKDYPLPWWLHFFQKKTP